MHVCKTEVDSGGLDLSEQSCSQTEVMVMQMNLFGECASSPHTKRRRVEGEVYRDSWKEAAPWPRTAGKSSMHKDAVRLEINRQYSCKDGGIAASFQHSWEVEEKAIGAAMSCVYFLAKEENYTTYDQVQAFTRAYSTFRVAFFGNTAQS